MQLFVAGINMTVKKNPGCEKQPGFFMRICRADCFMWHIRGIFFARHREKFIFNRPAAK